MNVYRLTIIYYLNYNIAQAQYRKLHKMRESGRDNQSRVEILIMFALFMVLISLN